MRLAFFSLIFVVATLCTGAAGAHLADEFPQVTLQITIDDEAVDLVVNIPAKVAKLDVFDGMSPVDMDRMEPTDLAALIGPVFAERCPVKIDGVVVPPMVLGAVVDMSNSRQPARRFPEPQVLKQGTLKFFARYETKGKPSGVSIDWSIFANEYDQSGMPIHTGDGLQVVAIVKAAGKEQVVLLTPEDSGYQWSAEDSTEIGESLHTSRPVQRNFINVPALSIVVLIVGFGLAAMKLRRLKYRVIGVSVLTLFASAACLPFGHIKIEHTPSYTTLEDEQALAIFEALHRNIYRAFDYTDESAVYDALAQSVDGAMLETIYNDVYQSLIMREEDGAVSKAVRVKIDHATVTFMSESERSAYGPGVYQVYCSWQVDGLVTHYGHSHARTNAFKADYTVAPRKDGWRIVDAEILQQRRIDDGTQTAKDLFDKP